MPCVDLCDLWLQTPDWYADTRVPTPIGASAGDPAAVFARRQAFAGAAGGNRPSNELASPRFDAGAERRVHSATTGADCLSPATSQMRKPAGPPSVES